MSENVQRQIKASREFWRPSKIANDLNKLAKGNIGKTILLQVENPENYYDTPDELPQPFIAELDDVIIEKLFDHDLEFDQLFIIIFNPRYLNRENIFTEYNYDYETLLKPQNGNYYKLNFNAVIKFSIKKTSFWAHIFKRKTAANIEFGRNA